MNSENQKNATIDYFLSGLLFLATFYNKPVSKSKIEEIKANNENLGLSGFMETTKKIGLISKVVTRDLNGITKLAMPVVLILKNNTIAILLNVDSKTQHATVIMPVLENKQIEMSIEDLQRFFTGKVIIVKPEYQFENKISKLIDLGSSKDWFWSAIKRNSSLYKKAIMAAVFINLFVLAIPLFMRNVFDRVIPNSAYETLWAMSIGIFFILVFDMMFSILRAYYLGKAAKSADLLMSNKIFNHLLNIKLEEKPSSTGQFVSRLQSFGAVREFLTSATITTLVDIPFALLFLVIIFYFTGTLGFVSLLSVIIILVFTFVMKKKIKIIVDKSSREEQIKQTTLNETVSGLEVIKSVRGQNRMMTKWHDTLHESLHYGEESHFLAELTKKTTEMITKASTIFVIIVGVYLSISGNLTMGGIIVAMMLNSRIIAPVNQVVGMIIKYEQMVSSYKSIETIMNMDVEKENKQYVQNPNLRGDIVFENVSFSYKGSKLKVLDNFNLTIKQGEKVAIVGKVGCGKSTVIKLLMNLYTPQSGKVTIGQTNIQDIDPIDLRKIMGVVPQESFLFMGSVQDNIVIGEQFVLDEEVLDAAKAAGVHDFIGKHEAGYDFLIGERGEGLSGGERQSISLARALLKKPSLLILDEPTASIDRQTEHHFLKNMKKILQDETLVLITHTATPLSLVDRVIVINDGKIESDTDSTTFLQNKKGNIDEV